MLVFIFIHWKQNSLTHSLLQQNKIYRLASQALRVISSLITIVTFVPSRNKV